jgi:N-acetylglucosaminyl-diphospho-decaprenol L-rhamnosyltransferase
VTDIGVAIVTYNSAEVIESCVSSILLTSMAVRVVVVDNASQDNTVQILADRFPGVTVIRSEVNLGYAQGNNLAVRELLAAGCRVVCLINPDVTVRPNTIALMERALLSAGAIGCVGARESHSIRSFRNRPSVMEKLVLYGAFRMLPITHTFLAGAVRRCRNHHYCDVETDTAVYAVSGACWAFKAQALQAIGMLDPRTFLYEEELIAAERLRAAGFDTVACPSAIFDHVGGNSTKGRPLAAFVHLVRSERILIGSYYSWNRITKAAMYVYRAAEVLYYQIVLAVKVIAGRRVS